MTTFNNLAYMMAEHMYTDGVVNPEDINDAKLMLACIPMALLVLLTKVMVG